MNTKNILIFFGFVAVILSAFFLLDYSPRPVCKKPYISDRDGCCLDANDDRVCDRQDEIKKTVTTTTREDASTTTFHVGEEYRRYAYKLDSLLPEGNQIAYGGYTLTISSVATYTDNSSIDIVFIEVEKPDGGVINTQQPMNSQVIVDDILVEIREEGIAEEPVLVISNVKK
jgi:hypothetical protein